MRRAERKGKVTDVIQLTLTLKMTTAQVVETPVTVNKNSPIQDYVHPEDHTQPTYGSKFPFLTVAWLAQLGERGSSLRKHPFLLALRRWGRFARNVQSGEERGETDVFAG